MNKLKGCVFYTLGITIMTYPVNWGAVNRGFTVFKLMGMISLIDLSDGILSIYSFTCSTVTSSNTESLHSVGGGIYSRKSSESFSLIDSCIIVPTVAKCRLTPLTFKLLGEEILIFPGKFEACLIVFQIPFKSFFALFTVRS